MTSEQVKSRIHSIDIMRGVVILLMLLDHVRERFFLHMQVADPISLYREPANTYVASFIGSPPMNLISGEARESNGVWTFTENAPPPDQPDAPAALSIPLDEPLASLARTAGSPRVVLGIRPEDVSLATDARPAHCHPRIEAVETMGAETHLHASTASHRLIARLPADGRYAFGDKLPLHLEPGKIQLFDADSEQALRRPAS